MGKLAATMDFARPIAIDLFAGAGGMTLGFEQAGFDVLAAVEFDPIHCATHEYNFPKTQILCRHMAHTSAADIRSQSAIADREIDVVFGGPPCQGFSLIGKRALDDTRNSLVAHFLRLVVELQPKFWVMENVPGMATKKYRSFLQEIIEQFRDRGYQVNPYYQILNAAHYAIPQNRERLFLLGSRTDIPLPEYPEPITKLPHETNSDLPPCPTVWEALQDLPEVEQFPELYQRDWVEATFGKPSLYGESLRELLLPADNYAAARSHNRCLLTSSLRTRHAAKSQQRFAATPGGKTEPVSRFFKLHPHGVCNTLRAGTPSNRGAFTSPRPIHPYQPRCITVREAARLHSYPDWFRFHTTKWHGFRQIGNSVPPKLAKAVATEILKADQRSPVKPNPEILKLPDATLLELTMFQAASRYGVDPHMVEPRLRQPRKQ